MPPQSIRSGKKQAEEGVKALPPTIPKAGDAGQQVGERDGGMVRHCVSGESERCRKQGQSRGSDEAPGETGSCGPEVTCVQGEQVHDGRRELFAIYKQVASRGCPNHVGARIPVPSGLRISSWRYFLDDYHDDKLADYLQYGWPINFAEGTILQSTLDNHPSASQHGEHLDHYIQTELAHGALLGPFERPPITPVHISPLMTREKKDSAHRRVIMELSWPPGGAVNDGVTAEVYIDGPGTISLPTVDYMEQRLLALGPQAYIYKTDLALGYRQMRVDPRDWPLLGFQHSGKFYLDICPPFGLRTSAMFMQRTSEAICFIHGKRGYYSRAYLDDFGGRKPM